MHPPTVPEARLAEIAARIDAVCAEALTDEYAALARALLHEAATATDLPLDSGKAAGWAAGCVRAVGFVNFLADPSSEPHLTTKEIAPLFGVSEATSYNRERDLRDTLDLVRLDPGWTLPSGLVDNPYVWLLTINGQPVDARRAPADIQRLLVEQGYLPFAPADPASQPPRPRWRVEPGPPSDDLSEDDGTLDPAAPRVHLTITLDDVQPPVWRTLLVPSDLPLDGLHAAIQAAMGWENYHLHEFVVKKRHIGPVGDGFDLDVEEERAVRVHDVLKISRSKIRYVYDFGDGWAHTVQRGAAVPPDPEAPLFECVDGAGACPPEDCGGPWGYADLREALADPAHPDHAEFLEWAGGPIDPHAFDLDEANRRLARVA